MLNWTRIEELRDEVGEDAFEEVVDLFLEEVAETLSGLGADLKTLESQLHFLKGASLNLGMDDFAEVCGAGERAARNGRAEEVNLTAVHDTYERSRNAFLSRVTQAGFLAA